MDRLLRREDIRVRVQLYHPLETESDGGTLPIRVLMNILHIKGRNSL
jgi:hypothetical protein